LIQRLEAIDRWWHISGLDLVRDGAGTWRVLEDNLRCPSGMAHFLENRRVMKCIFPSLFSGRAVAPIDNNASQLLRTLRELAPWTDTPKMVLLTPAIAHGIDSQVGSVEVGKLADLVLWKPGFFGVKPELVLKGGSIVWAQMGDANASIPTPGPVHGRPVCR
jgi:hypothetical protein